MQNRKDSIPGYLYALDGLRAVSLILIVIFHTWQQSWIFYDLQLTANFKLDFTMFQQFGFLAIDSFFVLSGFCLFYPIARDMFGESKFTGWKNFFIKRARRIYPAYVITLALCIAVPAFSYKIYDPSSFADVFKQSVLHLLFIHNFDANAIGSTISTAWTMAIEMQFYMLFPFICIPFRKKPVLTFAGLFIISQLFRFYLAGWLDMTTQQQAIPFAYLDVFGAGMLSAYFVVYARNRLKSIDKMKLLMTAISVLCIAAIVGFFKWMSVISFPNGADGGTYIRMIYRVILAIIIALFLFTACFSYDIWQKKIWGNRFFVFLSSISYTFYLWHQNVYIFLKDKGIPYSTADPVMNDRPAMEGMVIICLAVSLIASVVITKYIEQPIVKYGYSGCFKKITSLFAGDNKKK